MIAIPLTQGQITIVDDCDGDLSEDGWYAFQSRHAETLTHYAAVQGPSPGGRRVVIFLHRIILERVLGRKLAHGEFVDHISLNTLDNRRCNLRVATNQQNQRNKRKAATQKTSRYKGVTWHKHTQKWQARISVNKKNQYLGIFETEEEAARVYDVAAKTTFGEFALLNFP